VGDERAGATHENGREFRNIVALRPLLHVLEVVEAETDNLARLGDRQPELDFLERTPRGRRRPLGDLRERREVAIATAENLAEVGRNAAVDGLQIDHPLAFDHTEMQSSIGFETDDFHGRSLT
jgi:hypothetical protein